MKALIGLIPAIAFWFLIYKTIKTEIRYQKIVRQNPALLAAEREDRPSLWTGLGLITFGFSWIFVAAKLFSERFLGTITGILAGLGLGIVVVGLGVGLIWGWFGRRQRAVERHNAERGAHAITAP